MNPVAVSATTRLQRVLDLEEKQSWRNRAVIGGIRAMAERWSVDAQKARQKKLTQRLSSQSVKKKTKPNRSRHRLRKSPRPRQQSPPSPRKKRQSLPLMAKLPNKPTQSHAMSKAICSNCQSPPSVPPLSTKTIRSRHQSQRPSSARVRNAAKTNPAATHATCRVL